MPVPARRDCDACGDRLGLRRWLYPVIHEGISRSGWVIMPVVTLFSAFDETNGRELWVTDGTQSGTSLLKDIAGSNSSYDDNFYAIYSLTALGNGKVVFSKYEAATGSELWVTNGTAAGTRLLKDISIQSEFTTIGGGKAVFSAFDETNGVELWLTDGTVGGTSLLKDINPGAGRGFGAPGAALGNGKLVFGANDGISGTELWVTDGTTGGTSLVKDIHPYASQSSAPGNFVALGNGKALFTAGNYDHGNALWITDGTGAGTSLVKDIFPGNSVDFYGLGSFARSFTAIGGGKAVFAADDRTSGQEPWVTDGTAAGTFRVRDIRPGDFSSSPGHFAVLGNGKVLFSARDPSSGFELWVTDGTEAGTALVRDIRAGSASSDPRELTVIAAGRAIFRANDGISGSELWISDGTAAGTTRVLDIRSGSASSSPSGFTELANGKIVFAANDGQAGTELWITDGTAAGTFRLKDINAGAEDSSPREFATVLVNAAPQLQANGIRFGGGGTQVTLSFDEALAAGSVSPGAFAVTAGGQTVAVTGVGVAGGRATLTLGSAVALGASVTIDYADTAGDQSSGVLQDVFGNDVASFSATATRVVPSDAFSGMAYHWKSHALLSGVTLSAAGDGRHAGAASLLELRGLSFDANGDARFDVFAHAGTGIGSFAFDLRAGGDAPVTWTGSSFATWSSQPQTGPGQLTVQGSGTSPLSGEIKLGSVVVDLAAGTDRVAVDVLSATVGSGTVPAFSATLATRATAAPGSFALNDIPDDVLNLSVARGTGDTGNAISSADALAALKLAVGRNPNADPDGTGPQQAKLVSPYQLIAADVTGDGKVTSADALAILKMAVGRAEAPARDWIFVREDENFWDAATGTLTIGRNNVAYAKAPHAAPTGGSADLDFIGVLKGDVNGSWSAGGSGIQTLDSGYFLALSQAREAPLDLWG